MTTLLLDTQIAIWAGSAPERIAGPVRASLADAGQPVLVSSVSIAEMAIKIAIGKLVMPVDPVEWCRSLGFDLVDLRPGEASAVRELPLIHRDPFDRLLLAQAIANGWTLVSADAVALSYPRVSSLRAD